MNLQFEKKILIDWISDLEDQSIIEELKAMKENSFNRNDWWNQISEEERQGIEEGLKDIEEGRIVSYEDVKKEVKEWLTKSNSRKEH